MDNNNNRLALFGCGPHAKRIYINYMRSHNIEPMLIVDVIEKKDELTTLVTEIGWKNTKLFFLNPKDVYIAFSELEKKSITNVIAELGINKAIISTPQKYISHLRYFV